MLSKRQFIEWILSYPKSLLVISLAMVLAGALGLHRIWITNDYKVFFEPGNSLIKELNALDDEYTKQNSVFFIIGADASGSVFDKPVLNLIYDLTETSWKLPYALRVDSLTNYQHSQAMGDTLEVKALLDNPERLSQQQIDSIKNIYLAHPLISGHWVDAGSKATFVRITFDIENAFTQEPEVAKAAMQLMEQMKAKHPDVPLFLTGQIIGNNSFADAVIQDTLTLTPISYAIMAILLALMLRSVAAVVLNLTIVTLAILFALGVHGWIDGMVNPIIGFSTYMLLTVAVADCVHVHGVYLQLRAKGHNRLIALQESLELNLEPVFLTTLTTIIGFLCMNFSDSPPFRVLGNVVAYGVACAFVLSIFFLPSVVQLLPDRKNYTLPKAALSLGALARLLVTYPRSVLIVTGVAFFVSLLGLSRNIVDDNFVDYFDSSFQFRRANDYIDEYLPGIHSINYSLRASGSDGITQLEYLRKLDAFKVWYAQQKDVGFVESFSDTMKQLNMNMHGDDKAFFTLPDSSQLAGQYLLLYEMSLPFGQDLSTSINTDKSATKLTVHTWGSTSQRLLELEQKAQQWLAKNAPEMQSPGASMDMVFSNVSYENAGSMLWGSIWELILISMIMIFALRSFKLGLISLLPNLLPAISAFGLWGFLDGRIGLAVSVVGNMTLGIVVDDTVHFLSKYRYARKKLDMSPEKAVEYVYSTVGLSIIWTSVVFIFGFGALAFSHYLGNSQMGLLTAVTIAIALVGDLFFLPALLIVIDKETVRDNTTQFEAEFIQN